MVRPLTITRRPVVERFWEKVDRSGGPDACWPWTGCRSNGYGDLRVGSMIEGTRRMKRATHIAWEIEHGEPVPDGFDVLHRCDNPPCVNAAHLFLGTDADNSADKIAKGRQRSGSLPGESNGRAVLTSEQVAAIRTRYASGGRQIALAREFTVSQSQISRIVRGETWG